MTERTWSIGELAAEFDTTLRTIRFYEDRGLLAPERVGTTRIFHDRERVRLQLILRGKRLGFTLTEIAHVLDLYDEQPGERGQLEFLIADINRRRRTLEEKRQDLDEALAELSAAGGALPRRPGSAAGWGIYSSRRARGDDPP